MHAPASGRDLRIGISRETAQKHAPSALLSCAERCVFIGLALFAAPDGALRTNVFFWIACLIVAIEVLRKCLFAFG